MDLTKPHIIDLPKIKDPRGNLSFIQAPEQFPFDMERCYWIYDVPSGLERDGHAYHAASELIVALSGSFEVKVDNGVEVETFRLDRPNCGLIVPPRHWRSINNFATNSVAMILSSTLYAPDDYITEYESFKTICGNG